MEFRTAHGLNSGENQTSVIIVKPHQTNQSPTWTSSSDVTAMKRGFPDKPPPLLCIVVDADTGPDPSDPDPDVGPDVEAADPFWFAGSWGCNTNKKNSS